MGEFKKDIWGDVYKKDPFGSHQDFWGTRYSKVSTGDGGGLLGLIVIGLAIYETFFRDNPAAYVAIGMLVLSIVFLLAAIFIKNGKAKAILFSIAIYSAILTLTSSGDLYEIYDDGMIYYAILSAALFIYTLVCVGGGRKSSVFFGIIATILAVAYTFLVEPNIFSPRMIDEFIAPMFISQIEPLMHFVMQYGECMLLIIMIIEMPLYFAIIRKREEKKPIGLSLFALLLAIISGVYSYIFVHEYIIRLLGFSFAYIFIPSSLLLIALVGFIRKLPRLTPLLPALILFLVVSIRTNKFGYTYSEIHWLLNNFRGYNIIAYLLPVYFIGAVFSHSADS